MIKVVSVAPLEGHRLELRFDTGERRIFDLTPYLDRGIFTELKDPAYFRTARVAFGAVAWPHDQDLSPDTLYLESVEAPPERLAG